MLTGEEGCIHEEGYIFIVDRLKDMIVTGGENAYSVEVESVITTHPAVAACAVIGVPSEQWGELVHTVVVRKNGHPLEEAELLQFCKERMASYQSPRQVTFVDALPLSGAGKVLKTTLRAPFRAHHDRKVA